MWSMQKAKIKWLILITGFCVARASAQNNASVSGRITSEGRALASASVSINEQSLLADSNGFYMLGNLRSGIYLLRVSYTGYETSVRKTAIRENQQLSIDFS